jgi:hypothetical protein
MDQDEINGRYELFQPQREKQIYVYRLKRDQNGNDAEKSAFYCPKCLLEKQMPSPLQVQSNMFEEYRVGTCSVCKSQYEVGKTNEE